MATQELQCNQNLTNGTAMKDFDLASHYKVISGSLLFFGIVPFVLFNISSFPVGSFISVLLGALLMVVFQVVTQDEVYDVVGHRESLTAIFMLLGILIIAQYFEREQIFVKILRKLLIPSLRFESYILRVSLVSYLTSIFLTNDVCCLMVTPVLLKVWESQERPRTELDTLLLVAMTTANIGSMVTVFSSLQMALLAAVTSGAEFKESRLDMRACVMYLLPVSLIMVTVNTCFLILHYRLHAHSKERTKLVSEPTHSEQEMAGLTAPGNHNNGHVNVINLSSHGFVNGYIKSSGREDFTPFEGVYLGPAANHRSDDRISIPCQLETIPEDDILEISSSRSTSLRDYLDVESPSPRRSEAVTLELTDSSSSDSDEETERMRNTDENLHQLNINYRPGALQSQNLASAAGSSASLAQAFDHNGLRLSKRFRIYHSLQSFSVAHFLPPGSTEDAGCPIQGDSIAFLVILVSLLLAVTALLLASCYSITFDVGLIPLAAAVLAVAADAVLNRRPAAYMIKHCDWSVIIFLFGLFVWVRGFCNTHLLHYAWDSFDLRSGSYGAMDARTLAVLCIFVIIMGNVIGITPTLLLVANLLEPCASQRGLVLYLAILSTAGSNILLYASVSNKIVVHQAVHSLKYRLTFLQHARFGVLTSLLLLPLGIMLIYGLLLIGVE